LTTLKGRPVSAQTIQAIFRNPLYAGWMSVRGWDDVEPVRGNFESLVSEELFDRVQALLDGRALTVTPHVRNHPDFPLRRFVKCAECDVPLTGSSPSSGTRQRKHSYYFCRNAKCRAVSVPKVVFESSFLAFLQGMRPKPEYLTLLREAVVDVWKRTKEDSTQMRQRLSRTLEDLRGQKDKVVAAFIQRGAIDQKTYEREASRLDQEIALTESDLHDARLEELDVEGMLAFAEYVLTDAARLWLEAPLDQKQRLQKVLFPRGVTYSPTSGFGTAETSVIFRLLRAVPGTESKEVSPTGFEPVLPT
jgi:site-specific DNA recombinase